MQGVFLLETEKIDYSREAVVATITAGLPYNEVETVGRAVGNVEAVLALNGDRTPWLTNGEKMVVFETLNEEGIKVQRLD